VYRRKITEEWNRKVKYAIETQTTIEPIEAVVSCKDGSKRNISWGYITLGDKNYSFGIDLTEREKAVEALMESEYRWKFAIEGSGDGVWDWHMQTDMATYSKRWKEMLGYAEGDILPTNQEWVDRIHPDDQPYVADAMQAYLNGREKIYVVEYRLRCKDESYKWILGRGMVVSRSEDGKPIRMIGTHTDITNRKQMELELQEKQETYRNLIATTSDGFWLVDCAGKVLDVNAAYVRQSGYSREELLKMNIRDLDGQESQAETADRMRHILETGSGLFEVLHRRKDGSTWQVEVSTTYNQSNGGQFIAFLRNISERKEHENEHLKMEKLESLGILAGGIAHDFNNILTGIMGNISFARMFIDATHKSYKPLAEAEKASSRAGELAHQLLTFARGGDPAKKVVSLQHLVDETISLVLRGSNVKGSVNIPDSIHAINADEGQMSQAFNNIIINAAQAMPGGGTLFVAAYNVTLAVGNILSLSPGKYIRLIFTDQGCGISQQVLKKVFDPYFTTKPAGNGLGLASVHSIINRHGGHIGVTSVLDKETTFTIHLPSIGETYTKYQTDSASQTTGEHTGGSILVMDDEELIREMTTGMLDYLGYNVTTCEDGNEAVTLYKDARKSGTPFSAVIIDLTIPGGMGGKDTAQQILAIDLKACLLVSSGYSNDPIISDYSSYGFSGSVAKPYTVNELGNQLSLALSGR
jgi:PAS domain S-box-containing protein